MPDRRRVFLTVLLLIIAAMPPLLVALRSGVRDAPVTLGSDTIISADIPDGTPPYELTFMSNRAGNWDVMRLQPDGTLTNLTDDGSGAHDYFSSWSMDGSRINFISNRADPDTVGPTQVEPDGSNLRTLGVVQAVFMMARDGQVDWDPAWSPDGTQLAWASVRDLNLELYVADLIHDTNGDTNIAFDDATRLTNSGARDWFPAWSPDGTRIAFASDRDDGDENLFMLDVASGEITRLVELPLVQAHPAWSMDGETMLFGGERDDALLASGQVDLYLMDANGSNQRLIGDEIFRGDPVWSPDGNYIAYMSNETGQWQIYVMDVDGSNVRRLTHEGDNLFPTWRP